MTDGVTVKALAGLLPAQVIEELDHQAIVDRKVGAFGTLWAAQRTVDPTLPPIDTLHLASDPGRKHIELSAYDEMDLRARINDAGRSNLLFYSAGTDIDHLVIFHDVIRMAGEDDDALKSRTVLAVAGRSTGGPKERYEAIARAADVRVQRAYAFRIGRDPTVHVAIWARDNGGVADTSLLAKVQAALEAENRGLVNDWIKARTAVFASVDVTLDVWLLPDAVLSITDRIEAVVKAAWAAEAAMGFDLVAEWVQARAFISGVQRVVMTSPPVAAQPFEAITLNRVIPNYRGRAY